MLTSAFHLAAWSLDRDAETLALQQWISREFVERTTVNGGTGLAASVLVPRIKETTDLRLLRAIHARLNYGDSISLSMVGEMLSSFPSDPDGSVASIVSGPLLSSAFILSSEIRFAVNGLGLYRGEVGEKLNSVDWQKNGILLADATVRILNEVSSRGILTTIYNSQDDCQDFKLTSDAVAALILERGETSLDRILEVMKDRGEANAEVIRSILDSESQALSGGEL